MKPTGARIRIHGDHAHRQIDIEGQPLLYVDSVRIDEGRDSLQQVTVTFFTNQATVEPWTQSADTPPMDSTG
jgi:hypothetical protein